MKKGLFIVIEGIDGSGKTTLINGVAENIKKEIKITREPGGDFVGEKIRTIILENEMDSVTEILLFAASRKSHLKNIIKKEIEEGKIVICDRFYLSSIAYQGYGRNGDIEKIRDINNYVIDGFYPDLTVFIDISPQDCQKRIKDRNESNRLDNESLDFYSKVYEGYKEEIKNISDDKKLILNGHNKIEENIIKLIEEIEKR